MSRNARAPFTGRSFCLEVVEISREERDVYLIPQNFVDTGTILGGTVKLRNAGRAYIFEPGSGPFREHSDPAVPVTANLTHGQVYQRMCDFGATYVGLGFNPWEACAIHERNYEELEKMSKRIGYRIRPALVTMAD